MDWQRRSSIIILTLIGTQLALTAGGTIWPGHEMRRNLYRSQADCERDYSAAECQPTAGGGGSAFYHGPYYYSDRGYARAATDPGPGRAGLAATVETSMRGGFGKIGRAFARVG